MKKQELIKIIELVVRKEVKKQVNEIFINENKLSQEPSLTELVSEPIPKKVQKPKKKVQYTSNKTLNEVLNETVGLTGKGSTPNSQVDEFETLGGGVFDQSKMAEMMGYGGVNSSGNEEQRRKIAAVDSIKKAGVKVDQVPDHVTDALTKDYRGVLKAIDNKKNGGGFRP
jgi:hypothetical protein|tara:strand:+ start:2478 stop:2987 length:510 start_codon:yes stop_codon:yes gene_type:complete